jgi:hypothetical protein
MNVTREVILDLLPLYLADEASPATRALIEEYLKGDPELALRVREERTDMRSGAAAAGPPPELELRALRRTRRLLGAQRWLFAVGISCVLLAFSTEISFHGGRPVEAHLLLRDFPIGLGLLFAFGVANLVAYHMIKRKLRATRD